MYSPTSYLPLLRETKFYKRALVEDIEPTLRLDLAPGLNYFTRRATTTAINDNTLILEPVPSAGRKLITSCTLCGERRRGDLYARTHRFKTGDDSTQWLPLCTYCVVRFRSVCDYLSFLRMVRDGFWRCEGKEAEEKAWEESVRLRERMFWARLGGGVVPAGQISREEPAAHDSQRPSLELNKRISKDFATVSPIEPSPAMEVSLEKSLHEAEATKTPETLPADDAAPYEIENIRELPSTAPPLQASMNGELSPRQASGESSFSDTASSLRLSLTDSLKRISLRDSLRFGSRSRNASTERGITTPSMVASPRLGPVKESKIDEGVEEINEKQPPAIEREASTDSMDIKVPGGF